MSGTRKQRAETAALVARGGIGQGAPEVTPPRPPTETELPDRYRGLRPNPDALGVVELADGEASRPIRVRASAEVLDWLGTLGAARVGELMATAHRALHAGTPSPAEVGRRVDIELADLPRRDQPLTPAQHEALDVLHVVLDKYPYDRINGDLGLRINACVMATIFGAGEGR